MTSVTNWEQYKKLVEKAGSLSRLFSSSDVPFLHPRFIEQLYCLTTGAKNLAREDVSYDAADASGVGVGIKTFRVTSFNSRKTEKVAEFTAQAGLGNYAGIDPDEVALRVAYDRNKRVSADSKAFGISLKDSIYHCLVRAPGMCMVHEEKFSLIDLDSLELTNRPKGNGTIKFKDQFNYYSFSPAKNTLFKTFEIGKHISSAPFEVSITEGIFSEILAGEVFIDLEEHESDEQEFVVLPLYSARSGRVEPKSGINQWNAGGRVRKFGEAYIPIPSTIHKIRPDFFPPKDQSFELTLSSGEILSAKVCQDNGKALMSNPNEKLVNWLFSQIDGDMDSANRRLTSRTPYTREDLIEVGRESVKITKTAPGKYELSPGGLGDYEEFADSELNANGHHD